MAVTNRVLHPEPTVARRGWRCECAGLTDRGRVRRANEDAFCMSAENGAFFLCDGMGGAAGGATASRLASESALAALLATEPDGAGLDQAIRRANREVYNEARRNRHLEGMGTTLVALLVNESSAWIAHVGDSRCYMLHHGRLDRLTRDHSYVEEQMRIGRMTREQARRSPMQNVITRAVGTRPDVTAEIAEIRPEAGDLFLLASDGLTREVDEARIREVLETASDLEAACARLIGLANQAGGRDNITCVLVRIHEYAE